MALYVLDENKNRHEVDASDGLMTQVAEKIKGKADNKNHYISFITEAQYDALKQAGQLEVDHYYFITDDSTIDDLMDAYEALSQRVPEIDALHELYVALNQRVTALENPPTITFSIDGVQFTAKQGMTYGQWAISSYSDPNVSGEGFGITGRSIIYDDGTTTLKYLSKTIGTLSLVRASDLITNGDARYLVAL